MSEPASLDVYNRPSRQMIGGIPVFSGPTRYTENYAKISQDHLKGLEETGENPFMPQRYMDDLEEVTAGIVNRHISEGQRILDVGVGLGGLLSRVRCGQKFGMDISVDYLDVARSKGIECCMAMVEDWPYRDDCFDVITVTDVLEHVIDLNFCCGNVLSSLKVGGYLVVRVPYRENLSGYLSEDAPYELVHLRSFDLENLQLLFQKGFAMEFVEENFSGYLPDLRRLKVAGACPSAEFLEFVNSDLVSNDCNAYNLLMGQFFEPLEINVVFRKTSDTPTAHGYYLHSRLGDGLIDLEARFVERNSSLLGENKVLIRENQSLREANKELVDENERLLKMRGGRVFRFLGRFFRMVKRGESE